jgi:hypothetical protein
MKESQLSVQERMRVTRLSISEIWALDIGISTLRISEVPRSRESRHFKSRNNEIRSRPSIRLGACGGDLKRVEDRCFASPEDKISRTLEVANNER